ncbi:1-aminocyclopropane-1-carboxylate oxidase homolog 1-like [Ziziphus jujuba]|uniref:1-aminocyclopropane-1-carboxylate oxidase homolog 1-like n=1 Tax=Ziziphus jujuba TaxID=326968 RepID=A0ABM3ZUI7_ZIZJJ|nr:1-aminocyclopropane-1-carboxylate oxidase homolog 1-like [Ziziphus jujuba]
MEITYAIEIWGFFQVVNHGIPQEIMDLTIEGIRRFNEEPEMKMKFYSRDTMKSVRSVHFTCICLVLMLSSCRDIVLQYSEHIKKLGQVLFRLISMGLGLPPHYLEDMECNRGHTFFCHYYPPCPEPKRTVGHGKHSDPDFLTVLLQDHIAHLQCKLKSAQHRVIAKCIGPRISVACFFTAYVQASKEIYDPIKELLTDEIPPLYKEPSVEDYIDSFTR